MDFEQIFYSAVIGLWIAGVILYIFYFRKSFIQKKKSESDRKSKRKLGKRCPQCKNIINYQRPVCHHCGYQFPEVSLHEYRPGRKKKKRGKKCPECGNVVNYRREACHHCGYNFSKEKSQPESGSQSKPDQDVSN